MDHCSDKAVTGKKEEKVVSKSCRLVKGGGHPSKTDKISQRPVPVEKKSYEGSI